MVTVTSHTSFGFLVTVISTELIPLIGYYPCHGNRFTCRELSLMLTQSRVWLLSMACVSMCLMGTVESNVSIYLIDTVCTYASFNLMGTVENQSSMCFRDTVKLYASFGSQGTSSTC